MALRVDTQARGIRRTCRKRGRQLGIAARSFHLPRRQLGLTCSKGEDFLGITVESDSSVCLFLARPYLAKICHDQGSKVGR